MAQEDRFRLRPELLVDPVDRQGSAVGGFADELQEFRSLGVTHVVAKARDDLVEHIICG
jgi:hypothetical protein